MYAQLIRSQWRGRGSKQGFIASRMHYTTTSKTPTTPAGRRPRVKIVEVSPRDGLQNEKRILDVDSKVELITRLASHRLSRIEAGSFVSPRVKQMANTAQVLMHPGLSVLDGQEGRGSLGEISLSVLIPNLRGWHDFANTVDSMVEEPREIAVFVAATESFSRANLNMPIASSLEAAASVAERAKTAGLRVRGYVSCVVGCPYEGKVDPKQVAAVTDQLQGMGCDEVSLGDTIGTGSPTSMEAVLNEVVRRIPLECLAAHCHDTYGLAVANVLHLARLGVRTVDASVAGLGGCPYAPGASGNVATEDIVYALEKEGYDTGLISPSNREAENATDSAAFPREAQHWDARLLRDLLPLAQTGQWISEKLGRPVASRVAQAILASQQEGSG